MSQENGDAVDTVCGARGGKTNEVWEHCSSELCPGKYLHYPPSSKRSKKKKKTLLQELKAIISLLTSPQVPDLLQLKAQISSRCT